jgi:hypothetical protein
VQAAWIDSGVSYLFLSFFFAMNGFSCAQFIACFVERVYQVQNGLKSDDSCKNQQDSTICAVRSLSGLTNFFIIALHDKGDDADEAFHG